MTQAYECEVRYFIDDINAFEKHLKELGNIKFEYSFTDYYYKIDTPNTNLRIRKWHYPERPTRIYLVKNNIVEKDGITFKRSVYPEGKLPLYEGELDVCKDVLSTLGFEPWFIVKKKDAKFWDLGDFVIPVEYIEGIGWTGEIEFEGSDPEKAAAQLKRAKHTLGIKEVTFKSVSEIVAQRLEN